MVMTQILACDPNTYVADGLHDSDRIWPQTNCYADLWIELLHALAFDPVPALAFVLSSDVDGDQWRFFKFPLEDLRALYGIDVAELNPWQGLEYHIETHLRAGRFLTAEVDSWYLPDTAGVSYGLDHAKSSIVANMIDPQARRLGYFHNSGYAELSGDDYDGIFRRDVTDPEVLPPYVEVVRLDNAEHADDAVILPRTIELVTVTRAPQTGRESGTGIAQTGGERPGSAPWRRPHPVPRVRVRNAASVRRLRGVGVVTLCLAQRSVRADGRSGANTSSASRLRRRRPSSSSLVTSPAVRSTWTRCSPRWSSTGNVACP